MQKALLLLLHPVAASLQPAHRNSRQPVVSFSQPRQSLSPFISAQWGHKCKYKSKHTHRHAKTHSGSRDTLSLEHPPVFLYNNVSSGASCSTFSTGVFPSSQHPSTAEPGRCRRQSTAPPAEIRTARAVEPTPRWEETRQGDRRVSAAAPSRKSRPVHNSFFGFLVGLIFCF